MGKHAQEILSVLRPFRAKARKLIKIAGLDAQLQDDEFEQLKIIQDTFMIRAAVESGQYWTYIDIANDDKDKAPKLTEALRAIGFNADYNIKNMGSVRVILDIPQKK